MDQPDESDSSPSSPLAVRRMRRLSFFRAFLFEVPSCCFGARGSFNGRMLCNSVSCRTARTVFTAGARGLCLTGPTVGVAEGEGAGEAAGESPPPAPETRDGDAGGDRVDGVIRGVPCGVPCGVPWGVLRGVTPGEAAGDRLGDIDGDALPREGSDAMGPNFGEHAGCEAGVPAVLPQTEDIRDVMSRPSASEPQGPGMPAASATKECTHSTQHWAMRSGL